MAELKHIKTFESYSNNDNTESTELIEEGVKKKLVSQIDDLDKSNEEEVKKFFIKFFEQASKQTDMGIKLFKRLKTKTNILSVDDMVKVLNAAKKDFDESGKVGYAGLGPNNKLQYKSAGNIKTRSDFAGGGTAGKPSGGTTGA